MISPRPATAPTGNPPADELAEDDEIGLESVERAAPGPTEAERDDLIDDDQDAVGVTQLHEGPHVLGISGQQARPVGHEVDEDGGDLRALALDRVDQRCGVVVAEQDGVAHHAGWQTAS